MPIVAPVKLRYSPKTLWFGTEQVAPEEGDHVIVTTERGLEMGLCIGAPFEVDEDDLPAGLKPVVRIADEADLRTAEEHVERSESMFEAFAELVKEHKLDMKPIRVDYIFGGDKAVFYFVAEERVDFRDLVRELASKFHVRVDMRQIGVRDEARIVGDLGHCGQELCCARLGAEFQPVSIRMAKEQDLPLNPAKISGVCGRLMCCLRHEFEAYKDFKGRAPKKGSIVQTTLGMAKVIGFGIPKEVVNLRFEDGMQVSVPLGKMECDKKGGSCSVSREVLEEHGSAQVDLALSATDRESSKDEGSEMPELTEKKDGKKGQNQGRRKRRKNNGKQSGGSQGGKQGNKRSGEGSSQKQQQSNSDKSSQGAPSGGRRKRRRRAKPASTDSSPKTEG